MTKSQPKYFRSLCLEDCGKQVVFYYSQQITRTSYQWMKVEGTLQSIYRSGIMVDGEFYSIHRLKQGIHEPVSVNESVASPSH